MSEKIKENETVNAAEQETEAAKNGEQKKGAKVRKNDVLFKILLVLFFPVGICYFLTWALKKLIVMSDSGKYEDDIESDRERREFVLAGIPSNEAKGYLKEGVKLDMEYSPGRDMHTITTAGNEYVGYIDRRNAKEYEAFSPTTAYVKKVDLVDDKYVVTAIMFK